MDRFAKVVFGRQQFMSDVLQQLASGFAEGKEDDIARIGRCVGRMAMGRYTAALGRALTVAEIPLMLVDFKRKIGGCFGVADLDTGGALMIGSRCPFGDPAAVEGETHLCDLTEAMFGAIAAEITGSAQVRVASSIAAGDGCCVVEVRWDGQAHADASHYQSASVGAVAKLVERSG